MTHHTTFQLLFELWPTWSRLVRRVSSAEPETADPQSIFGAACTWDLDRLAAYLYAEDIGESFQAARDVLNEVLAMAREGRRPKSWPELGLTREMVEGASEDA